MKILREKTGYTLVELLVTVAIFGILMTGIASTFRSQVFTFYVQEATTDIQMSGSLSLMKMEQEARLAGFGVPKNLADGTTTAITAYVNNDGSAGNADSVTIRYVSGAHGYYNAPPVAGNYTLALTGTGFEVGDTVKVLSLRREDLFPADVVTVTGVAGDNVTLSKRLDESAIFADLGVFVGAGLVDVRYDIANAGTNNVALQRTITPVGGAAQPPEIMAFGIEDLQVAYGIDENMDQNVDTYVNTPTAAQLTQVVALRISLIMRSTKLNEGASAVGLQAEDGNTHGGDQRDRRLFSTTVRLRNARVI